MALAGGILLLLGAAGELSDQPAFDYLMIGVVLALLGFFLWRQLRPKRERPRRFSIFRKRSNDQEQDQSKQAGCEDDHYV